jgi:hypothetical protein
MFRVKLALSVLAAGAFAVTAALADDSHHQRDHQWNPADMAAHHKEMCMDRYAHRVGEMAYLEAKLSLSDTQHPLFDAWKSAVLSTAKSDADACASRAPDFSHPPTILDREAMMHQMLQTRLAALDAEGPALQSFYQSLSPDQKAALDRGPMGGRGMHGRHGFHGPHGGPGDDGHGPDAAPPPNG